MNAWTQAGSSNDNVYLCVPLCCLTSVYIHMFMWCQGSGHFTLVCAVVSQMRGTAVCHNYNYACWKDLTEGEVCLVPLMALKLCALPSFKKYVTQIMTVSKHFSNTSPVFGCLDSANVHTQLGHSNAEITEMQWGAFSPFSVRNIVKDILKSAKLKLAVCHFKFELTKTY